MVARGRMVRGKVFGFVLLLVLPLALASSATNAAALGFRAEVDRDVVPVGGQIALRLIVSGEGQDLPRVRIGAPPGFDAYSAGSSQSISIVNGRVEASLIQSFVLIPKKEGTFTLGPFELRDGRETLRTDAITVRVTAPSASPGGGRAPAPAPAQPRAGAGAPSSAPRPRGARPLDYFARALVDKRDAYVNEQVTFTFKFYSRVQFSDDDYTAPEATGFWVEDLPPVRRIYEEVDGVRYLVYEKKSALFPTSPGTLTIGPATLKLVGVGLSDPSRIDPFQMFNGDPFAMMRRGAPELLRTDPISISVRALPAAGRPADFSGLVGEYSLSARLDKETVEANQPLTMTLIVSGDGNLQTAPNPAVVLPPSLRAYDSGSRINTSKENYKLRGEKVVETVLIPQAPGELSIPPATLVTFDPKSGTYRTLRSDTLRVRVLPASSVASAGLGSREVRSVGRDFHAVREGTNVLARTGPWLYERKLFWVAQGIPLVLFLGALRVGRARRALEGDRALSRARGARGIANRRLREARRAEGSADEDAFFTLLARSLSEYAADTLGVSRHGVSRDDLTARAGERGVPPETIGELRALLDRCDMGRFAPGGNLREEREELLRRAEEIILGLEKALRG